MIFLNFTACGARSKDRCAFHGIGLDYLFFECPSIGDYFDYLWQEQVWLWTFWYLSQIWITFHIWFPKSPRLASTEQLFGTPMYCSLMIDQSLVLNRRADGVEDLSVEDLKEEKEEDIMDKYEHLAYPAPNQSDERSSGSTGLVH